MNLEKHSIQLLQEHIIDQIKAGEVIERPSTLIKEIIENSIDAGSKNISIEIQQNGLDFISIEDDGHGIEPNDLPLAFCRHATSKIARFEDLYSLSSYGFRGEALASIASISRVSCDTKTTAKSGMYRIEGGETLLHEVSENLNKFTGTKLFIKDLFYNTPARMKFIQSATTEKNKIKKILNAFLLTNPQVSFDIKWDLSDKEFFEAVAPNEFKRRIGDSLFRNKNVEFYDNENSYDGVNTQIYLTKDSSKGNAHKQNYIFINNRYVQDVQLHKIILNSALGLWPDGESGSYIAKISIPSDELDVNVHPNKTIIKFFKPGKVLSLVSSTVKQIVTEQALKNTREAPPQVQNSFMSESSSVRDFSYGEFEFSSEERTQSYFDTLHGNISETQTKLFEMIKRFKKFCLVEYSGDLYILNLNKLIKTDLNDIISNLEPSDSIPLLVSKPIKLSESISASSMEKLSNMGFDCDLVNSNSLLVRSFPKSLQNYPYLKMLELMIEIKGFKLNDLERIDFEKIGFDQFSDHYISEVILKKTLTELLKSESITPLLESQLEKLHGY